LGCLRSERRYVFFLSGLGDGPPISLSRLHSRTIFLVKEKFHRLSDVHELLGLGCLTASSQFTPLSRAPLDVEVASGPFLPEFRFSSSSGSLPCPF